MGVWLGVMLLAAPPRGVNPPDFSPQARRKADSVHFAWRVHYYERIIPWNRPNPILQHPQIQQCLGYTLQNGRVVFPKTISHERLANRLEIVYTSFFFPAYVLVKCGFLPSYLTLYLRHVREFIPLTEGLCTIFCVRWRKGRWEGHKIKPPGTGTGPIHRRNNNGSSRSPERC